MMDILCYTTNKEENDARRRFSFAGILSEDGNEQTQQLIYIKAHLGARVTQTALCDEIRFPAPHILASFTLYESGRFDSEQVSHKPQALGPYRLADRSGVTFGQQVIWHLQDDGILLRRYRNHRQNCPRIISFRRMRAF